VEGRTVRNEEAFRRWAATLSQLLKYHGEMPATPTELRYLYGVEDRSARRALDRLKARRRAERQRS
jgi:hypothetical protein